MPEGTYGTGPTARVRSVASIVPAGDSLLIDVPAQVRRGETLQVALSVGAGGCTRPDTIAVNVSDLTAAVVPYVSDPTPESMIMCTADFRVARATAAIVFAQTGEARVRIIYRSSGTTLSTVERRVRVTD